jgi:hypothetical protein
MQKACEKGYLRPDGSLYGVYIGVQRRTKNKAIAHPTRPLVVSFRNRHRPRPRFLRSHRAKDRQAGRHAYDQVFKLGSNTIADPGSGPHYLNKLTHFGRCLID